MSTSTFLRSMTKPQRPSECSITGPSTTCSHQSTGWLSPRSYPSCSTSSSTATLPPSLGGRSDPGSPRMPGHVPAGPTSHGYPFPFAGPPTCKSQPPTLPVCSYERQVAIRRQPGGSLKEPMLCLLLVCSQERQVTASRTLGGSLKEPPLHSLPVRSLERQVTISQPTGNSLSELHQPSTAERSSSAKSLLCSHGLFPEHQSLLDELCSPMGYPIALPTMATQPPPPVSQTAQVGFPGTHSCNTKFVGSKNRCRNLVSHCHIHVF